MKSKKIRSLFCAAALTLSLAACGSKTSDYSDQTITGEITDIDGTAVTMQLGELSAGGMPSLTCLGSSVLGQTGRPGQAGRRNAERQQLYRGRGECDARLRECGNYKK